MNPNAMKAIALLQSNFRHTHAGRKLMERVAPNHPEVKRLQIKEALNKKTLKGDNVKNSQDDIEDKKEQEE